MLRLKFPVIPAAMLVALFGITHTAAHADLAALTRTLDAVEEPLDIAIADAEAGRLRQLRGSLKSTQDAWREFYIGYRSWGTGVDPNWMSDVDAVQAEFMNATNAVTPGNNAPLAATTLKKIKELLWGLRERNEVPDVQEATSDLSEALKRLQTQMKSLEGKTLTQSNVSALKDELESVGESWNTLQTALIDLNVLGLSDGDLATLRRRVETQNKLLETIDGGSASLNVASGLQSINSALEGLQSLAQQWRDSNVESGAKVDSKPKRRVLFR